MVDEFIAGYVECALWSDSLNDEGEAFDGREYHLTAWSQAKAEADCRAFVEANAGDLGEYVERADAEQAGHDFWLTRRGHGAGYWDRGMGDLGDRLSAAARATGDPGPLQQVGGQLEFLEDPTPFSRHVSKG